MARAPRTRSPISRPLLDMPSFQIPRTPGGLEPHRAPRRVGGSFEQALRHPRGGPEPRRALALARSPSMELRCRLLGPSGSCRSLDSLGRPFIDVPRIVRERARAAREAAASRAPEG